MSAASGLLGLTGRSSTRSGASALWLRSMLSMLVCTLARAWSRSRASSWLDVSMLMSYAESSRAGASPMLVEGRSLRGSGGGGPPGKQGLRLRRRAPGVRPGPPRRAVGGLPPGRESLLRRRSLPSLLVRSSSRMRSRMYLSGTRPSLPAKWPLHQSGETWAYRVRWSPRLKDSSRSDRAAKSYWAVASSTSDLPKSCSEISGSPMRASSSVGAASTSTVPACSTICSGGDSPTSMSSGASALMYFS
uniref:Uncharacterized protein n=1 Tax=Ixodes ricinus TaxID=34613 RepID=A0A6B0V4N3_IXORI